MAATPVYQRRSKARTAAPVRMHPLLTVTCLLVALTIAEAGKRRSLTIGVYTHVITSGPNRTEPIVVAGVNGVLGTQSFGAMNPVDVRAGFSESSLLLGQVRGLGVNSRAFTGFLTFTITYRNVSGQIQVHGTDFVHAPTPFEFSIVGGTGDFALARGLAYLLLGPSVTDAAGVDRVVNRWNLTLYQDVIGPKLKYLHSHLSPDLAWW